MTEPIIDPPTPPHDSPSPLPPREKPRIDMPPEGDPPSPLPPRQDPPPERPPSHDPPIGTPPDAPSTPPATLRHRHRAAWDYPREVDANLGSRDPVGKMQASAPTNNPAYGNYIQTQWRDKGANAELAHSHKQSESGYSATAGTNASRAKPF